MTFTDKPTGDGLYLARELLTLPGSRKKAFHCFLTTAQKNGDSWLLREGDISNYRDSFKYYKIFSIDDSFEYGDRIEKEGGYLASQSGGYPVLLNISYRLGFVVVDYSMRRMEDLDALAKTHRYKYLNDDERLLSVISESNDEMKADGRLEI